MMHGHTAKQRTIAAIDKLPGNDVIWQLMMNVKSLQSVFSCLLQAKISMAIGSK